MSKLKTVGLVAGGLLTLTLVIGAVWGFQWFTAPFRGSLDAREQIQASGDFRIQAYERFFDLCTSVQNHEATIEALEQELDGDPSPARTEQIEASITANRAQRRDQINTYNSEAARDWTVGQFRDEGLPFRLDSDVEDTKCTL